MAYFLYRKDLAFFVSPKIAECIINNTEIEDSEIMAITFTFLGDRYKTIIDSHSLIRLADFYQISLDELCGRKKIPVYKNSKIKSMILANVCTLWTCFASTHR